MDGHDNPMEGSYGEDYLDRNKIALIEEGRGSTLLIKQPVLADDALYTLLMYRGVGHGLKDKSSVLS
jgi:hypothetical protein